MILVLGGTSESVQVAETLNALSLDYVLSVTTQYGATLAQKVTTNIQLGKLDHTQMRDFIKSQQITLVLDASHPFATIASKTAIAVCQELNCPYLRFERPQATPAASDTLIYVKDLATACTKAAQLDGPIYFTTGSKTLPQIPQWLTVKHIIARVLPTSDVLQVLDEVGLVADQIDGLKGPFSTELNIELLKKHQARALITKESGQAGGFFEKIAACEALNIPCIVIEREKLNYPQVVSTLSELSQWLKEQQA